MLQVVPHDRILLNSMCSSGSSVQFPSSTSIGGTFSIPRCCCTCSPAQSFTAISFKARICDLQFYSESLVLTMKAGSRQESKNMDRDFPRVLPPKCEASRGETSPGNGFQWRKRSDVPELQKFPSFPSSPSSSKRADGNSNDSRAFQKSSRRPDQRASKQFGTPKGKLFSGGGVAATRARIIRPDTDKAESEISEVVNGTSEGKRKKPPKIREQIRITSPISKEPKIAILGGGMSGLICALTLQQNGIRSTLFDTGKHGLGGRMGTRHVAQVNGDQLTFDHAAQFFTATDPRFKKLVDQWIQEGAVREWKGVVGTLELGGKFTELQCSTKYIAANGMRLLAGHLISNRHLIDVIRPCWISRLNEFGGMWHLSEYEKDRGEFDIVVIAHNGKCANRLLGPIGVPLVAKQMKRLELSSIWAVMAAFERPLPTPSLPGRNEQLEGAFVIGIDSVSWMGNNTAKLQTSQKSGPYCWTFLSSAKYGKKNKVPQESIPTARAERVKREVLQGVEKALGLEEGSLPAPLYMKVQLWGAANPINSPHVPCIFDAYGRVGICGDWLLGSNLEAAALSGMAMANHISAFCERKGFGPEEFSVGLDELLLPVGGHDIGQFSGQKVAAKSADAELLSVV